MRLFFFCDTKQGTHKFTFTDLHVSIRQELIPSFAPHVALLSKINNVLGAARMLNVYMFRVVEWLTIRQANDCRRKKATKRTSGVQRVLRNFNHRHGLGHLRRSPRSWT